MRKDVKNLTDMEVINLCLNEDGEYFEEMINRYKNLVYSISNRMVNNAEDVKDLTQEIFIKIYRNLDKYSPEFKFSTWIMRIATNHIIDFRRKKRVVQVSYDEIDYEMKTDISPETLCLEKEHNSNIKNVVNELPEIYKQPIILYHEKDMSYKEIAEELNEPLSKVKNRIFRGRKLLREKFEPAR
ncbi:MAG: RNA polymerase sigma factor [Lachnospirales bacterium]